MISPFHNYGSTNSDSCSIELTTNTIELPIAVGKKWQKPTDMDTLIAQNSSPSKDRHTRTMFLQQWSNVRYCCFQPPFFQLLRLFIFIQIIIFYSKSKMCLIGIKQYMRGKVIKLSNKTMDEIDKLTSQRTIHPEKK